jgi:hypothetical protein
MIVVILALLGAGILAGVGVFTFFGGYWYEYLRGCIRDDNE